MNCKFLFELVYHGRSERFARRIPRDTFNDYYSELKQDKIVAIRLGNVLF